MNDHLYVIGAPGCGTVKIGVSNRPKRRLREIQLMSPLPLSILWSTPGSYDLEKALHARFAKYRSHGEWFTFPAPWTEAMCVRNAYAALRYAVDDLGNLAHWPDVPMWTSEESLHGWLGRRLRNSLYHRRSFTLSEAAKKTGVPAPFVRHYGAKLADLGWIVDQKAERNGERLYCLTWDEEDFGRLLEPRSRLEVRPNRGNA